MVASLLELHCRNLIGSLHDCTDKSEIWQTIWAKLFALLLFNNSSRPKNRVDYSKLMIYISLTRSIWRSDHLAILFHIRLNLWLSIDRHTRPIILACKRFSLISPELKGKKRILTDLDGFSWIMESTRICFFPWPTPARDTPESSSSTRIQLFTTKHY
jgi:hypothetical protein